MYDKAGEYQVTYGLGEIKSAPLTIIVKGAADTPSPTNTPEPVAVETTPTAAEPANTLAAPTPASVATANTTAASSIYNVWTLVLLPLLGLAVGWFIWGRGKN